MRDDMAERFSEPKGRYKKGKFPRRQKAVARKDEDGHPMTIHGMAKPHKVAGDWHYDNGYGCDYSILRRFLISNSGRPWDDVWSEICEGADDRTHDGYRLREAVDHLVERNCTIGEDGKIRDAHGFKIDNSWHRFYIHPKTNTLQWAGPRQRWRKPEITPKVYELDGQLYHEHEGVWYRVEMKEMQKVNRWHYEPVKNDVFNAHLDPGPPPGARWYYFHQTEALAKKYGYSPNNKVWYCVSKQSANSKEIEKVKRKHKLGDQG